MPRFPLIVHRRSAVSAYSNLMEEKQFQRCEMKKVFTPSPGKRTGKKKNPKRFVVAWTLRMRYEIPYRAPGLTLTAPPPNRITPTFLFSLWWSQVSRASFNNRLDLITERWRGTLAQERLKGIELCPECFRKLPDFNRAAIIKLTLMQKKKIKSYNWFHTAHAPDVIRPCDDRLFATSSGKIPWMSRSCLNTRLFCTICLSSVNSRNWRNNRDFMLGIKLHELVKPKKNPKTIFGFETGDLATHRKQQAV